MTDSNEAPQIEVNADPLWDQLMAGIRQAGPPIIAFAMGRHWIEGDTATLAGTLGALAFIVVGQLHTRHRAKQLANIVADPRVPPAVAKFKGA